MANRIFELQETKGTFQVRGIINGVDKERFYTDKKTKTGKDFSPNVSRQALFWLVRK